jgi:hypothetical protein
LKFIEGPKCGTELEFSENDGPVFVGRMVDCKIRFFEKNVSRY